MKTESAVEVGLNMWYSQFNVTGHTNHATLSISFQFWSNNS